MRKQEEDRWREVHLDLSQRFMFTPSVGFYCIHMANNSVLAKLYSAADSLASAFAYAKYYFLDMDTRPPVDYPDYPADVYDPTDFIESVKDLYGNSSDRINISRADAIEKVTKAAAAYNSVLEQIRKVTKGASGAVEYPSSCSEAIREDSAAHINAGQRISVALTKALRARASQYRKSLSSLAEEATFTVSESTVSCFLKGDPVSPRLLGIEVGSIVNGSFDYEITSISGSSFSTLNPVASVQYVMSPLSVVESRANLLKSFALRANIIKVPEVVQNASEFVYILQQMVDSIRMIDESKTPAQASRLGLELKSLDNLAQAFSPEVGFTKSQRDFAIKTLDLVRNNGYDLTEYLLKNYQIPMALELDTLSRSLDSLALDLGFVCETFVAKTARSAL